MEINRETYAEFFLLYVDGELDPPSRHEVEKFIEVNPDLRLELELLRQTTFTADPEIIFGDKSVLYKKEDRRIIPFAWWKISAAAVVLISITILGWLYSVQKKTAQPAVIVAKKEQGNIHKQTTENKNTARNEGQTVKDDNIAVTAKNMRKPEVVYKRTMVKAKRLNDKAEIKNNSQVPVKEEAIPEYAVLHPRTPLAANLDEKVAVHVASFRENTDQLAVNDRPPVNIENEKTSRESNVIYFANTSFPRKTKFREVFRKASRVLEKVTSIGSGSDLLRRNDMVISTQ